MSGPLLVVAGLLEHGAAADGSPLYLLTKRPEGVHLAGTWELPGGKIESHEDPGTALVRELDEELGIVITEPEALTFSWHAYPEHTVLLLFYGARIAPGSPEPQLRAAEAMGLFTRQELLELPLPPANGPFLDWLRRRA